MPFTPIHMGPGIFIKSLLQGSFSLMVFGWPQIVMDIQPLIVILTGKGHIHGFTHTYLGAVMIALVAALSGKYLAEIGLKVIGLKVTEISQTDSPIKIAWWVCFLSAFIGSFSHVLLDSFMHYDLEPFFPFSLENNFVGLVSIEVLHKFCLYSGLLGAAIYYFMYWKIKKRLE